MNIWLKVTADEYEFPLAIADSAEQLGNIVGVSKNCIYSSVSHANRLGYRSQYVKVEIEEDDTE